MSNSIVLFTGTMTDSVRNTIEEYGPERLQPGDVIVANDPYRTGTHVNDMLFVRPVFHDGAILAFANLKAHQLDMGGAVPGGFSCTKRTRVRERPRGLAARPVQRRRARARDVEPDLRQRALRRDPLPGHADDRAPAWTSASGCSSRAPSATAPTRCAARSSYVCDANAERIAEALAELPDGRWEGWDMSDCDGADDGEEYRVQVAITKRGDRLEVDFSGTSRQARTCINATALDVKTTVGVAVKYLLDPRGAFTSGLYRNIDIVLPEGTVVSALPPDGAVFAYYEQSQVMLSALLRAFAGCAGEGAIGGDRGGTDIHNAFGLRPDGTPWVSAAQCGGEVGPFGATRHGDGETQMFSYQANGRGDRGRGDRGRRARSSCCATSRCPTARAQGATAAARRWCATRSGPRPPSTT